MTINCFFGWRFRQCDEAITDSEYETMHRHGWGYVAATDAGSPTGEGLFYACADHRTDCTEGERTAAKARAKEQTP